MKQGFFRGHDFSGQSLRNQDLREADLRNCTFYETDLRGANLERANLSGANLTGAIIDDTTRMLGCVMNDTVGAMRNGGPIVSVIGLRYPILIDGKNITFGCETIQYAGRDSLDMVTLLKMDKAKAVRFHDLGAAVLKAYREQKLS